jgi:hypothetical protein
MLQPGQNLALASKSFPAFRTGNAANQLDGYLLLELAVVALAKIHRSHSAAADLFHQPVGANVAAG